MKPGVKSTIFILMLVLAISLTGCVNENSDNGNNQHEDENTKQIIYSSSPEDISQLTMLETFKYDFDVDGTEEEINLYTSAQKDNNGEIMWDDGQVFKLIIHDTNENFVLFDEYVQLGKVNYYVYLEKDVFTISIISPRTASLTITDYVYDKDVNGFLEKKLIEKTTDINMLKI